MTTNKAGYLYMLISKIIIVALIIACLFLSKCALDPLKDCSITVSETSTHIVKCDSCPTEEKFKEKSGTSFGCNRKLPSSDKIVQKKVSLRPAFCTVLFAILAGAITALLVLFAKDENCIKCVKLDELRVIREKILSEEFRDSVDKTVKEDVNNTNKVTTETTDNRVKLLKHYMSCVADI